MPIQELVFGRFLQNRRKELELTPNQLALKLGYRNANKGIRRIAAIESGEIREEIINKIMKVLNVSEDDRLRCSEKEETYIDKLVSKLP